MQRALERADRLEPSWDAADIHQTRVALRRCRTMADALREVIPDPGWRAIKKQTRDLFQALGQVRDTQVARSIMKEWKPSSDPVRKFMLGFFSRQERKQQDDARKALAGFHRKDWRKLSKKLQHKSRFFPSESVVFQRLALAKLNEAVALYQQARKNRSSAAWHRLRIAIKQFRYIVENFLPQRYEVWAEDMKQLQDALGKLHDLDVLRGQVRRHASRLGPELISPWTQRIDERRKACIQDFLAKVSAKDSPWIVWRAGFCWEHAPLVAAAFPRRRTA
jgi:CHAD domain-containing protein